MSYDNNEVEYEPEKPKKADVLIKGTQTIVAKQEELSEQTKLAISRIDEAIELCHKNSEEAAYILDHSTEMFEKLQAENSSLKQELLYLAKQSENIYAGLAEKLNELQSENEQAKSQPEESVPDEKYYELADRLAEIYDRLAEMTARIDALSEKKTDEALHDSLNDKFAILYDKIDALFEESAKQQPVVQSGMSESDCEDILDKLDRIMETVRKNEGAHSMLADKFEILSMRVEQFGFESAKNQPAQNNYPAAPVQANAEIDYDKLASKVAEIISVRETVSPDYIASKVAEQIVLPEQDGSGVEIDTQKIAEEVAALMNVKQAEEVAPRFDEDAIVDKLAEKVSEIVAEAKAEPIDEEALADKICGKLNENNAEAVTASAAVEIDEDALAEKIAEKLNITADGEVTAAPVTIDEDSLAEKIAGKLNVVAENEVTPEDTTVEFDDEVLVEKIVSRLSGLITEAAPASTEIDIDQEDLADMIALKVGSIKPEDFEIMVDDAGCASISREIAEKIDYNVISTIIADKLREVLDLNIASAPDYEDMAERISEKITVAGINEDAIAEKAAAVLSNYLPEFDTEEIADKVTGAVIDVVSAMPQPTLDSEAVCNEIAERLMEKQEDNNYDIVIDDDGISRITAIVTEEIAKDTSERFDRLEESIANITEMLAPEEAEETEEEIAGEEETEEVYGDGVSEEEIASLSEVVATEIEKGTASRFDKVEEDIAKIYEIVSNIVVEEEEYDETEELEEDGETEDTYGEEVSEEEYQSLSEMLERMEENLTTRIDGVEEKITSLTDLMTEEEQEVEDEEEYAEDEEEYAEELEEDEYAKLSEIVSARFDSVEEKIDSLTGLITGADEESEEYGEDYEEATEEDYAKLSEIVAAEIEKGVAERFESVEENIRKINAIVGGIAVANTAAGSGNVETDIRLYEQFDRVSEDIRKISEYVQGDVPVAVNERLDRIANEIAKISRMLEGEISVETNARLDRLQEEIEKLGGTVVDNTEDRELVDRDRELLERVEGGVHEIKGMLIGGAITSADETAAAQTAEVEEEVEELVTVNDIVKPITIGDDEEEDDEGDFLLSALDMDKFSDDERMPGELGDLDGVDFENMMKYNRSFIARIIQSDDDCKQYYGAVKHALLSYKKVNSNVAWGNERFNKGRETIARMKIRGKTLVIYLALDPNEYKTSVYHHADVSDNKSVLGTPMMIKVKSPLGVRKAIRLIDEMLEKRNGEKRELPERDYAAMYPYETIEELIEDGLVKDVRKK